MHHPNKGRLHACLSLSGQFVKEDNGSYKITMIVEHNYNINPCYPFIFELDSFTAFNTLGPQEESPVCTFFLHVHKWKEENGRCKTVLVIYEPSVHRRMSGRFE